MAPRSVREGGSLLRNSSAEHLLQIGHDHHEMRGFVLDRAAMAIERTLPQSG